jgi:hypothetical protein
MPQRRRQPRKGNNHTQVPFSQKLILNQWVLSLFNVKSFEKLADLLRDDGLEGLNENNVSHFHEALISRFYNLPQSFKDLLLEYDQNIVRHTQRLSEQRVLHGEKPLVWKYFQYLSLLFTEIYLDRYFAKPKDLLAELNQCVERYNAGSDGQGREEADLLQPFDLGADATTQLNKISFWMATGSGKTLIMHANILQYLFYLEKHDRRRDITHIILLTPNEGLSQQHLREFERSGIDADIFQKEGSSLFIGHAVEIIEVTKLREDSGEKTIAAESFLGNNLVLVDEGHRGASGGGEGAWMKYRNQICENGFSFEYSATFGQAVKGDRDLADQYAKNILVDYSYRYFYEDGFGKDYQILNLDEETERGHLELYLTACLLTFYQQLKLYKDEASALRPFLVEKPLWVFVGSSVTKTLSSRDASDIVDILKFFARYVRDRKASIQRIQEVLTRGLVAADGRNIFERRFVYLNTRGFSAEAIFDETLAMIFNAPAGGLLYLENLKGAEGEIALRLGAENQEFGVINVGDDASLLKLCAKNGLETGEREFSGSLFQTINDQESSVNLLIGSKKFTEGWSSWRVSTMGLMNVGKGEGAQIIQLFGRGVRLKGYNLSLKRSSAVELPPDLARPQHLGALETLSIFGIHANYMAQFREYLKDEGLSPDKEQEEILLPVIKRDQVPHLKMVRLQKTINGIQTDFGDAFRKAAPIPTLCRPDPKVDPAFELFLKNKSVVNWYPRIQAMKSKGLLGEQMQYQPNEAHLTAQHVAFLDLDALYFELERFKAERGWFNLNIPRSVIGELLVDPSWYTLLIPKAELAFGSYERVRTWQEIALALLKKYLDHFYSFQKQKWELPHLEVRYLEASDPNLLGVGEKPSDPYYRVAVDKSDQELIASLRQLKERIENRSETEWNFRNLDAIWFAGHLFQPLLIIDTDRPGYSAEEGTGGHLKLEISPVPLNRGEGQFVRDIKEFYAREKAKGEAGFFAHRELFMLRNLSRGKGVGFFEAGNFHPDFMLWLVDADGRQHVRFVDPKGTEHIEFTDAKIDFYQTIKDIEKRLADPDLTLDSYILSDTSSMDMMLHWNVDKAKMLAHHVVFLYEDKEHYLQTILADNKEDFRPQA